MPLLLPHHYVYSFVVVRFHCLLELSLLCLLFLQVVIFLLVIILLFYYVIVILQYHIHCLFNTVVLCSEVLWYCLSLFVCMELLLTLLMKS